MSEQLPQLMDPDAAVFTISVAATLAEMHPQTLRTYDRQGLVVPRRTKGGGRRYSPRDVQRLRLVQHLSQNEGINLVGIRRILALQNELDAAQRRLEQLAGIVTRMSEEQEARRVFLAGPDGEVGYSRHRRMPRPRAIEM
ncbi:hypothetical protein HMPREF1531_00406 [Propionibacterium sp. oral taxon 192 str. F0372]|uniref:heat shock protein transcriptional repressor HspR n=1 Tax=Propionibacterium sp. oral taxon 192 TaxID=671222 RepID=UPI000353E0A1|nr:helix-turn-helix transcriptional regulator [Propionibacterium sp. oral taxon 192]EPH06804.1 hypothetical protein HMPREF1531_00406 [Propionibacterium sp. oral taxon 192 str. F0372]